jgi:hypothetical protein
MMGDRVLLLLVVMIMITNLLDATKLSVLLPVWAREGQHNVAVISLLLTGSAAFSTVSSLLASWLGPRLPRRTTYFVAFAVAGPPPFLALGLGLPVWAIATVFCLAGFASGFLNPIIGAILFERIPRPLLGRVGPGRRADLGRHAVRRPGGGGLDRLGRSRADHRDRRRGLRLGHRHPGRRVGPVGLRPSPGRGHSGSAKMTAGPATRPAARR